MQIKFWSGNVNGRDHLENTYVYTELNEVKEVGFEFVDRIRRQWQAVMDTAMNLPFP